MNGINATDVLKAELAQARRQVGHLTGQLQAASSQRMDAQIALAWMMRKNGELAIAITQADAKSVMETCRLKTAYGDAVPDGSPEGTEPVKVMTVEMVVVTPAPAVEKPLLRLAQ
jgi:hypothetical protein